MEHSLRAYLERLPTEKLECFLHDCRSGDVSENYDYLIPVILEVLMEKKAGDSILLKEIVWKPFAENY